MDKTSFIFHTEWGRLFRLLQMMCDYAADNIEPEDTPDMVGMAFDCIRGLMDFDKERYHAACEKRRQAVQKRWDKQKQKDAEQEQEGAKNTNIATCMNDNTKHTYTDSLSLRYTTLLLPMTVYDICFYFRMERILRLLPIVRLSNHFRNLLLDTLFSYLLLYHFFAMNTSS